MKDQSSNSWTINVMSDSSAGQSDKKSKIRFQFVKIYNRNVKEISLILHHNVKYLNSQKKEYLTVKEYKKVYLDSSIPDEC